MDDSELQEIQQIAQDRQMTTEQWVRKALTEARRREGRVEDKLGAVRKAVSHSFPTADIEQMLSEIEQGYGSEPSVWPESFWRAFGGVTEDFARPPQVRSYPFSLPSNGSGRRAQSAGCGPDQPSSSPTTRRGGSRSGSGSA
ncbi:MAG TPA: hypothetical protein VGS07_30925 [Thermoanaerobaculia bacterium]|nr:hypothetical protein [Thermoanaerobaculia bacterium]